MLRYKRKVTGLCIKKSELLEAHLMTLGLRSLLPLGKMGEPWGGPLNLALFDLILGEHRDWKKDSLNSNKILDKALAGGGRKP